MCGVCESFVMCINCLCFFFWIASRVVIDGHHPWHLLLIDSSYVVNMWLVLIWFLLIYMYVLESILLIIYWLRIVGLMHSLNFLVVEPSWPKSCIISPTSGNLISWVEFISMRSSPTNRLVFWDGFSLWTRTHNATPFIKRPVSQKRLPMECSHW